jgi:hypothetical protein
MKKRLARLLDPDRPMPKRMSASAPQPRIHKLSQRLQANTVTAMQEDYRDGSSLADLQENHRLGRGSVQRLLREAGVRQRRKSLTSDEVAVLVKRYEPLRARHGNPADASTVSARISSCGEGGKRGYCAGPGCSAGACGSVSSSIPISPSSFTRSSTQSAMPLSVRRGRRNEPHSTRAPANARRLSR